jgi:hypothetical protein
VAGLCAEVANPEEVFGEDHYVGHDEPATIFYSDKAGSGNNARYQVKLPVEPPGETINQPGKSYSFLLNGSVWFGMALCDSQSYPETTSTCTPDSDSNIADPGVTPNHAGEAFSELQFYPPGWIPWPTWAVALGASSCDPTKWCAALNIFSLAEDPIHGTTLNSTCAAKVGVEYLNFAWITLDGKPSGPANPLQATLDTYDPTKAKTLLMGQGDDLAVTEHDTARGLQVLINDKTTGQTGTMTASAANGFAQVKYTTDPSTECTAIPYDFHPMYSTSSEKTRVTWAAHSYNVSFSDETGHWEFCTGPHPIPVTQFGLNPDGSPVACPAGNKEGIGANKSPTDSDDDFCFNGQLALRYHIDGCTESNTGFDGYDYTPVWPDGNTQLHPTPFRFTSPLTGSDYTTQYSRIAFEADLPRIEPSCDRFTGDGCTLIPQQDNGQPAQFYPFYSTQKVGGACYFQFGNHIPNDSNEFGQNAQWGTLLQQNYLIFGGNGRSHVLYNDFRNILSTNPCKQS